MTIRNALPCAESNDRLTALEACAEYAPDGSFVQARAVTLFVGETSDALLQGLRALGLVAPNDDRLREVEAVVYGYIREANPDLGELRVAEGFGSAMGTPARERVLAAQRAATAFLAARQGAPA